MQAALRRLCKRGRIANFRRGFYVIVPLEYRAASCLPASWFIADLMRFLDQDSYIGLLSAAAMQGADHQQLMVFQVITDRPTQPAYAGHVATVLSELAERLDADKLRALAHSSITPHVQRLDYFHDFIGEHTLAETLLMTLHTRRVRPVPLNPKNPLGTALLSSTWRVFPNENIEVENGC